MSWEEDMEQHQKETASTSDFYKFGVGQHVMRIMSEPAKKASRFGYGVCYEGAPYCDPAQLQREYEEKVASYELEVSAAKTAGKNEREIKAIKKPSRPHISVKWSVWALIRGYTPAIGATQTIGEFKIVDLPNGIAEKLLNFKRDGDMGTAFDGFPMPYDVKITVSRKKVANPGPKDIEYDIVASTKRFEVSHAELADFEKKAPVSQIIDRMGAKAKERFEAGESDGDGQQGGVEYPAADINPDDIPF